MEKGGIDFSQVEIFILTDKDIRIELVEFNKV